MKLEDLKRLERLDREACPAPWYAHEDGVTLLTSQSHPLATLSGPGDREVLDDKGRIRTGKDGELIIAARNAIPVLLREREDLLQALRKAKAALRFAHGQHTCAEGAVDDAIAKAER